MAGAARSSGPGFSSGSTAAEQDLSSKLHLLLLAPLAAQLLGVIAEPLATAPDTGDEAAADRDRDRDRDGDVKEAAHAVLR